MAVLLMAGVSCKASLCVSIYVYMSVCAIVCVYIIFCLSVFVCVFLYLGVISVHMKASLVVCIRSGGGREH